MNPGKYLAAPAKLLLQLVLLAGIPLAALGWLGKGLLQQDRELESQRQRDRVENTANGLADQFDRGLSSWENSLPGAGPDSPVVLPFDAIFLLFDTRGLVRQQGVRLPYYPVTPPNRSFPATYSPRPRPMSSGKAIPQRRWKFIASWRPVKTPACEPRR